MEMTNTGPTTTGTTTTGRKTTGTIIAATRQTSTRYAASIARQKIQEYYTPKYIVPTILTARAELARMTEARKKAETSRDAARERAEAKVLELAIAKQYLTRLEQHISDKAKIVLTQSFLIHPTLWIKCETCSWINALSEELYYLVGDVVWYLQCCESAQYELNLTQRCTDALVRGVNPYDIECREDISSLVTKYGSMECVCQGVDIEDYLLEAHETLTQYKVWAQEALFNATLDEVTFVNSLHEEHRVEYNRFPDVRLLVKCFIASGVQGVVKVGSDGHIDCVFHAPCTFDRI